MYTNVRIADSVVTNEDYAKRASELGHGIISTMEHGWQGRYIEGYELAQQYNLKFVFGTEAYWVKDREKEYPSENNPDKLLKDSSNCHICIFARNENGRQAINDILSEANITGYYIRPRIDISLILSLPPEDVIVTTACVAYWKYDDIDEITEQFHQHFGKNFYLEVQYHNTDLQREINRHVLELSEKLDIPLIMGCDSHYIYEDQAWERTDFLASKGIEYPDEEGWYMDYPDGITAYKRFADQCVLSHDQIIEAMNNTNVFLEVEEYDSPIFNHEVKLPTIYPELSQEERDKKFTELVWNLWEHQKHEVPKEQWPHYVSEIMNEVDTVVMSHTADYFLLDYEIVKLAKERGGELTPTGRGSAVSYYINKLLGFTKVDRIAAKVKMYPERFMSAVRILQTKSLPDIDMNVSSPEIFWQAQKDIIGDNHAYQMIAYGTMAPLAAWKMYAKASGVDFDTANEISQQIKKWQIAVKHADEDDKDDIDVFDYIQPQYHEIYKRSERYRGIVASWSIHPCASLVFSGNIRKEIGLTYVKSSTSKEGILCTVMDGKWAEEYKFLKNDWLTVQVVKLMYRLYRRIGMEVPSVEQLLQMCVTDDGKAWSIYKRKCTLGINQVEQPGTSARVGAYAPTNISELCAFVAAIRPGFKSMYKIFESRQPFSYNIPSFDALIQTDEMPNSFVLYQEMAMAALNYAGIDMAECYAVIKNIAKKRVEKVLAYKDQFLSGFAQKIMGAEHKSQQESDRLAHQVWQILEDSSRYSFNASHSYCVSLDGLYCAWVKAHYPLEFYEVYMQLQDDNSKKDKIKQAQLEAEQYFNITFPPYRYGQDNTHIAADLKHNSITNSMKAIKGFNQSTSEILLECSQRTQFTYFIGLLLYLKQTYRVTPTRIMPLIKIGYFQDYGNIPTLLAITDTFEFLKEGEAKKIAKDKLKDQVFADVIRERCSDLKKDGTPAKSYTLPEDVIERDDLFCNMEECIRQLNLPDITFKEKIRYQLEVLGYVDLTTNKKEDIRKLVVISMFPLRNKNNKTIWAYVLDVKSIGTGKVCSLTVDKQVFDQCPLSDADVIYADKLYKNKKGYWYLEKYWKLEGDKI